MGLTEGLEIGHVIETNLGDVEEMRTQTSEVHERS